MFNRSDGSESAADLEQLTRVVRRFTVEQQQVPKDLTALVTLKYLGVVPQAPSGKRYVIDRRKVEVRLEPVEVDHKRGITESNSRLRSPIASDSGQAST